jgi:Splicing regulator sde2, C-terminal
VLTGSSPAHLIPVLSRFTMSPFLASMDDGTCHHPRQSDTEEQQFIVRLPSGRSVCFSLAAFPCCLVSRLHRAIEEREGVPVSLQRLVADAAPIVSTSTVGVSRSSASSSCPVFVSLCLTLSGGKGGFGSLLRATTSAVGTRRTTDFSAMRDLHGRRIRHLHQERQLEDWKQKEETKTEEERKQERRETQEKMRRIRQGKAAAVRECRWGTECKYRHTCRLRHPDDEEEKDGAGEKRRRTGDGSVSVGVDDSWQAAVVDEDDIMDDVEEGMRATKGMKAPQSIKGVAGSRSRKRKQESDDSEADEEEKADYGRAGRSHSAARVLEANGRQGRSQETEHRQSEHQEIKSDGTLAERVSTLQLRIKESPGEEIRAGTKVDALID